MKCTYPVDMKLIQQYQAGDTLLRQLHIVSGKYTVVSAECESDEVIS